MSSVMSRTTLVTVTTQTVNSHVREYMMSEL